MTPATMKERVEHIVLHAGPAEVCCKNKNLSYAYEAGLHILPVQKYACLLYAYMYAHIYAYIQQKASIRIYTGIIYTRPSAPA